MRALLMAVLLLFSYTTLTEAREVLKLKRGDTVFDADPKFQLFGQSIVLDEERDDNRGGELINAIIEPPYGKNFPFEVRTARGIRNGFAVIQNGRRYIVFDYDFYNRGDTAGFLMLTGHEIGHHVCGHTIGLMQNDPYGKELEADRYSGAAIKKHAPEVLAEVIAIARNIYDENGSATHPPREQRVAAIMDGFYNGTRCKPENFIKFEDPKPGSTLWLAIQNESRNVLQASPRILSNIRHQQEAKESFIDSRNL